MKASLKSPTKEKDQKDAELKAEGAKDTVISDAPPQLPETATASEPAVAPIAAATEPAAETTAPKTEEDKAAAEIISTPNREKKAYLSGFSFINKRDRSVSPSAAAVDAETSTETPAAATSADKADEKVEDATPVGSKRQSVLGGLGRRASKMIQRVQPSKKETTAPATAAATTTTTTEAKKEEETAATEVNPTGTEASTTAPAVVSDGAEEIKPEPVNASAPPAVTASA